MRTTVLLLLFLAMAAGQGARPAEPEEVFVVEIDGEAHELVGDRVYDIEIHGKASKVRVAPLPYRVLTTKWFSLRFPRRFNSKYDDGADVGGQASWTIEGPNTFIQLTKVVVRTEQAALDAWANALTTEGSRKTPLRLALPEQELNGVRIEHMTKSGMRTRSDLFAWKAAGQVWLLQIYDNPGADGQSSAELRPAYEMLRKTLKPVP